MPDLTVSTPVDDFMQSADAADMQTVVIGGPLGTGVATALASAINSSGGVASSASPTFSGVQALTGTTARTLLTASDTVNVSSSFNQQTISDDSHTLTFSTTPTVNRWFAVTLYNTDTAPHIVTLATPCMWQGAGDRNQLTSVIEVPPVQSFYSSPGQRIIRFISDGTNISMYDSDIPMDGFRIGNESAAPTVEWVGDSLTAGSGGTAPSSLVTLPDYNGQAMASINLGVPGRNQAQMYDLAWTNVNPRMAYNSGFNLVVLWANTNGMLQGNSAATEYSYTEAFCRRLKLSGFKVLVCTAISLVGKDSVRDDYNTMLEAGWTGFCDGLIPLAANADIGADGAYMDTTYFNVDGIHLKTAGDVIAAGIMETSIDTLVAQLSTVPLGGPLIAGSNITLTPGPTGTTISASGGGGGGATGPTNSVQANVSGTPTGVAGLLMDASTGALTQTQDALGATTAPGLVLTNTTAAVTGGTQVSPQIVFHGSNFDENSASSKTIDIKISNEPPIGSFFNYGKLVFKRNLNGAGDVEILSLDTQGNLVTPSFGSVRTADVYQTGKTLIYNNVTTAGQGVPSIYGAGRVTAQTAAASSVATYTTGGSDASFVISANVNVTASTTHSFTTTCAYTDETNTARTLTLNFSNLAGTFLTAITNVTGSGPYEGVPVHIRAKAGTAITVATTGTFTSVTYNAEAVITQIQ